MAHTAEQCALRLPGAIVTLGVALILSLKGYKRKERKEKLIETRRRLQEVTLDLSKDEFQHFFRMHQIKFD